MSIQNPVSESPLSPEEIELISQTDLSKLDQHHLRLLAHCLECFKAISRGSSKGPLPTHQERLQWCYKQPSLEKDSSFISVLLTQLSSAAAQLEDLAGQFNLTPLELTLQELIQASLEKKTHS